MSVDDNKRLLQRFVQDVLDAKNLAALPQYLSKNFFHHDLVPGERTNNQTGIAGLQEFFGRTVFPGFSEFKTSFDDMIGDKDLVAGRWSQSVRQTGPWLGRPPSNSTATIGGISIVRVRDNLIVEEWEARDTIRLLTTFGVIPRPRSLDPVARQPTPTRPVPLTPLTRILTGGPLASGPSAALSGATSPNVGVVGRITTATTTPSDPKTAALTFVTGILNDGKLSLADSILASDFVDHEPVDGQVAGGSGIVQFASHFRTAFPDAAVTPDISLTEGDKVVTRWTAAATHRNTFLGVPASGRRINIAGINIFRVRGGAVAEKWGFWPLAETLQQLSGAN